jgi:hypothetical protein
MTSPVSPRDFVRICNGFGAYRSSHLFENVELKSARIWEYRSPNAGLVIGGSVAARKKKNPSVLFDRRSLPRVPAFAPGWDAFYLAIFCAI